MKRLLLSLLCSLVALGSATNFYITPSGSATGGCPAGTTPAPNVAFGSMSSSNWGSGTGQIGPGTTVLLCGTWNVTPGTAGLAVLNSGSSGNPITINFDSGAIIQSAYLGAANLFTGGCGPSSSCLGGIQVYQQNYVIIDGKNKGIIQNTANGTSLANQQPTTGVYLQGDHLIVRNLTVQNLYINGGSSPGATDTNGGATAGIRADGPSTNLAIYNNVVTSSAEGISTGTSTSTGPANCPAPNGIMGYSATVAAPAPTGNWGTCIYNNSTADHNWHILTNGQGTVNIFGNSFGDYGSLPGWLNWQFPGNSYHQDGVFIFGDPTFILTANVYGNLSVGDLGQGNPTAHISCAGNDEGGANSSGCSLIAYNNILVQTGSAQWPNDGQNDQLIGVDLGGNGVCGPIKLYNNTLVGGGTAIQLYTGGGAPQGGATAFTYYNNIWIPSVPGTAMGLFTNESNGGVVISGVTASNNIYFNDAGFPGAWQYNNTAYSTLAGWQAACSCDTSGTVLSNPNLSASYRPNIGSPALAGGINLTSLMLPTLDIDAAGNPRPGSGAWTAGAYQGGSITLAPIALTGTTAAVKWNDPGCGSPTYTATANWSKTQGLTFYPDATLGVTGLVSVTNSDGTIAEFGTGITNGVANTLPQNSVVTLGVACGGDSATITLTTPATAMGDGFRHPIPFSAANTYNYAMPAIDPNVRAPVIDPVTGMVSIPLSMPGWFGQSYHNILATTYLGASAGSPPAFVNQCASASATGDDTTVQCSATINVAAGNTIAVWVRNAFANAVSTVCDGTGTGGCTGGDTFTSIAACTTGDPGLGQWWYAKNTTANATATIVATFSAGDSYRGVWAGQFSGPSTASPLDQGPACNTGTSTSPATASFTTTAANEVLLTGVSIGNAGVTPTAGAGYTLGTIPGDGDMAAQYQIVSSIQTGATGGMTISSNPWLASQITLQQDQGWTNPANVISGSGSTTASIAYGGSGNSAALFIPFVNTAGTSPLMNYAGNGFGGWSPYIGITLDDIRVSTFGSGNGAVIKGALTMVPTIAGASFTPATLTTFGAGSGAQGQFPAGANWPGTTLGQGCYFCDWGLASLPPHWTLDVQGGDTAAALAVLVTASGGVLTCTQGGGQNGDSSIGCFNMLWPAGMKVWVGGSAAASACTNSLCTLAASPSTSGTLTLVESLTDATARNFQAAPGLLVWIAGGPSQTVHLSVSLDYAVSGGYQPPAEGFEPQCSPASQLVSTAADGVTPIIPTPAEYCGYTLSGPFGDNVGDLFWFFPQTGEVRLHTPLYFFNSGDATADQLSSVVLNQGIIMHPDSFDETDPNTFYLVGTTNGPPTNANSIFRGKYNAGAGNFKAYAHTLYPAADSYTYVAGECNTFTGRFFPGQNCAQSAATLTQWADQDIVWTNLTKASASNDVLTQVTAGDPNYSSTLWATPIYGGAGAGHFVFKVLPSTGGETINLFESFPVTPTETSSALFSSFNTWQTFGGPWCAQHSFSVNHGQFVLICNQLGGVYGWVGSASVMGIGPWQSTPTAVCTGATGAGPTCPGGSWNANTAISATVPNDTCPTIPSNLAGIAHSWTGSYPSAALSGTPICMTLRMAMPCSLTPATGEAGKWPCPDGNGGHSSLRNLQPGDGFMVHQSGGVGGSVEYLLLVSTPVLVSGTTWEMTFLRGNNLVGTVNAAGMWAASNGWTGFAFPPPSSANYSGGGGGLCIWFDLTQAVPVPSVDIACFAAHSDVGNGPTPGAATTTQGLQARFNSPLASQFLQPYSTFLTEPSFNGTTNTALIGGNTQSYPSMRQVSAAPADQNAFFDNHPFNPGQGVGPEVPNEGNCAITMNGPVMGTSTVYYSLAAQQCGASSYKSSPTQVTAGPYLLKDVSGPSCTISDATPWTFGVVLKAGDCFASSIAGTVYYAIPNIQTALSSCQGNWMDDPLSPCPLNGSVDAGSFVQMLVNQTDPIGSRVRNLGTGLTRIGTQFQFGAFDPDPLGRAAFYQENWGGGVAYLNRMMAMVLPPTPAIDSMNRNEFLTAAVRLPSGSSSAVNLQFGYAQYAASSTLTAAGLFCRPAAYTCFTNGARGTQASPFLWSFETANPVNCSSGCTIYLPVDPQTQGFYVDPKSSALVPFN